ncbi:MAG: N-acetylneuraminate synthase family protein [Phycisphaerae bacterium]|nr:N-acetylneuraminate synthase family protein [Phycisphaerae bacterium]MDD5239982.1 N-acetylneuraminate synthase family protein [Candidatus Nanoarchaeia archaeon]
MELISECCLNHGGNLDTALEMIRVTRACGVGIAKFQFYYPDILCADRNCFDAYKLLDKIKLRPQWIPILAEECKRQRVEFLCTGFCKYSIEAISKYVSRFKIASPEVKNLSFLKNVASYGKPMIISTGRVTHEELDKIFETITVPITLLYCRSLYPALPGDYDLKEIDRLRDCYKCKVGVSCHCIGIKNAIDAVKYHKADMVEKHFMLSGQKCVDAAVSIEPQELLKLNQIIKEIGNGK